jgi:hypothetical protein
MKIVSGVLACFLLLLAPVGASAQGSDWRSVLEGEKGKNAQRLVAIEQEGAPIAAQLRQVTATIKQNNLNPCTYPPGHPEACAAYERERVRLDTATENLRSRLIPLVNEQEKLQARNAEIDRRLSCQQSLQPCSSNSDCCSGNCALFADGRLSDARVCQPSSR